MERLALLAAYIVGFGLLQVLLYRHFRPTEPTPEGSVDRGGRGARAAETDDAVRCEHCGTVNDTDRSVRYCRTCAESLR